MSNEGLKKAFRSAELLSYLVGTLLTAFFVAQLAQGEVQRHSGIVEFKHYAEQTNDPQGTASVGTPQSGGGAITQSEFSTVGDPDTSLWAKGRIADYQASLEAELPEVLGVLEIPSVGLKVPVYTDNSELVMDRAAGVINGMSYPHEPGNIGISSHRDGYFRVLKDVKTGDALVLQTLEGEKHFKIDAITVVEINDKTLLRDTDEQTVTLVTCYPFYFVGHAPKRYIVTASLDTNSVK